MVMAVLVTTGTDAAAESDAQLIVSPISPVPSGEAHSGKLVWVDLVTTALGKQWKAVVRFYKAIAGYDALRFPDVNGGERIVLGTDGKARATIVPLPWDDVEPNWIPYIPVLFLRFSRWG